MTSRLQIVLLSIIVPVILTNIVWGHIGHFDVEVRDFVLIDLFAVALSCGGYYYDRKRHEDRLAAMLYGTAFLIVMANNFSLLNNLLLTIAGPRVDGVLAAADRAIGVDWPAMMAWAASHPWINVVLLIGYSSMLPQLALLVVVTGLWGQSERIYALCIAVAAAAAMSITVFTLFPSFGAFSVYALPSHVTRHLIVALDARYANSLIAMLAHGPGHISAMSMKGLIGFPSYHAALAMIVLWYAREIPVVRWIALVLNAIVLIATPIQGGHDVVDVLAGAAVTAAAIWVSNRIIGWAKLAPLAYVAPQTALT
jgi:hypothetical protein